MSKADEILKNLGYKKEQQIPFNFIEILENILDELIKNNTYSAKVGNMIITHQGIKEDTAYGKREVFIIERWLDENR